MLIPAVAATRLHKMARHRARSSPGDSSAWVLVAAILTGVSALCWLVVGDLVPASEMATAIATAWVVGGALCWFCIRQRLAQDEPPAAGR